MNNGIPPDDPLIGAIVLGRYRVVAPLAAGGMGAVYLARVEGPSGFVRPVAIKRLLRTGDTEEARLFAREARVLSRLRHPAIVSVHDFARHGPDALMALDYVHGYTLSEWAGYRSRRQQRIPIGLAVHAVLRVLAALHCAHTARAETGEPLGVIHRDVKPSNVLIDVQGEVKLADFGLARDETETTTRTTSQAVIKGTFTYMAPELLARVPPGPATDVYSAAVMLYAVLAGNNPFADVDIARVVGRILSYQPPRLHRVRTDVPERMADVVATGMNKDPAQRFCSASAFAAALRACNATGPDVEERFERAVASDFGDAAFAELLGVPSLAARATAWSRRVLPSGAPPLPVDDEATRVDRRVVLNLPVVKM